nr:hypothetical protein [Streptomyces specialis]
MSGGVRGEPELRVRRAAAAAARGVPGVAYLRPGITDLLRGAAAPGAARSVAGVRARAHGDGWDCLFYPSPSPRDRQKSRMPSSA